MSTDRTGSLAVITAMLLFQISCADDVSPKEKGSADAGTAAASDAGTTYDGDSGPPLGPDDVDFTLSITFDGQSVDFERAYYGVTAPRNSPRERWELYVEAYAGGVQGCPSEDSPTPDQTLIVAGVAFPQDAGTTTDADGLAISFLDFTGELSQAPIESARGEQSVVVTSDVCRECDTEPDGFVVLDIEAPFTIEAATAAGEAAGRLIATHCPSLDAR